MDRIQSTINCYHNIKKKFFFADSQQFLLSIIFVITLSIRSSYLLICDAVFNWLERTEMNFISSKPEHEHQSH